MNAVPHSIEGLIHIAKNLLADYQRRIPDVLAAAQAAAPDGEWLIQLVTHDHEGGPVYDLYQLIADISDMRFNLRQLQEHGDPSFLYWPVDALHPRERGPLEPF